MEERRYRSPNRRKSNLDLEALAKKAPVIRNLGDFANPNLFPDDAEYEEFLEWIRAERQRDLA